MYKGDACLEELNVVSSELKKLSNLEKKRWHVIYVKARHEKSVCLDLSKQGIESYLPLRKELHQWSDRKKWIEVPLFSCYVFVRILHSDCGRVYLIDGFVKFVGLNGKPSVIPESQMDAIRRIVEYFPTDVEVLDGDYRGFEAEITTGPLSGLRGEIVELVNGKSFVIRVDGLEKLLSVKVSVGAVRIAGSKRTDVSPRPSDAGTAGHTSSTT